MPTDWAREVTLIAPRLLVFVGLREAMIGFVWRAVAEQLNTSARQLETLLHPAA
jgi:hypothetical protein